MRPPLDPERNPHGTIERYKQRGNPCRCTDCRAANAAKNRHYRDLPPRTGGPQVLVDPRPAQAHLQALRADVTVAAVAGASGLSRETVDRLLHGDTAQITSETARIVLALTADECMRRGGQWAPAGPTVQRLRSLMALGWNLTWQAEQMGLKGGAKSLSALYKPGRNYVRIGTEQRVKRLYDRVGDERGPDERIRRWAEKRGWHVPGAYDEHMRLIPGAALAALSPVDLWRAEMVERRERVAELHGQGYNIVRMADMLRVKRSTIESDVRALALARRRAGDEAGAA